MLPHPIEIKTDCISCLIRTNVYKITTSLIYQCNKFCFPFCYKSWFPYFYRRMFEWDLLTVYMISLIVKKIERSLIIIKLSSTSVDYCTTWSR